MNASPNVSSNRHMPSSKPAGSRGRTSDKQGRWNFTILVLITIGHLDKNGFVLMISGRCQQRYGVAQVDGRATADGKYLIQGLGASRRRTVITARRGGYQHRRGARSAGGVPVESDGGRRRRIQPGGNGGIGNDTAVAGQGRRIGERREGKCRAPEENDRQQHRGEEERDAAGGVGSPVTADCVPVARYRDAVMAEPPFTGVYTSAW